MNTWAIILAAGKGQRFIAGHRQQNIPKQYIKLHGKTILEHAIEPFLAVESIKRVLVVVAVDDTRWKKLSLQHQKLHYVDGGKQRFDSCLQGLQALAELADDKDWVCVHDAARPCITTAEIKRLLTHINNHAVGGILAYPVIDTLKRATHNETHELIQQTITRDTLWHALTPQVFPYAHLRLALTKAIEQQLSLTDEAMAIEYQGWQPCIVRGSRHNIKLTYSEDLELIDFYLQRKRQ